MTTRELHPAERVERVSGAEVHYWVYREDLAETGDPAAAAGSLRHVLPVGSIVPVGAAAPADPAAQVDRCAPADTVLMVHGLRGTHHGLELVAAGLPDQHVVIPDLPGFGDSGPMTERRHDVAGYAHVITELIERLGGRTRPIVLLGHSFGSIVAARVASANPELVRRLVLINAIATPALRGPHVVLSGLTSAYYTLGKRLPLRAGHSLLSNRWVVLAASRAMTRTKDKRLRGFIDESHLRYFSRFHSPALLSETFEASVTHTVADHADALRMPTLLIAGESDEIAPLAGQRALAARLADAELVVIPDVGHLVHYETPGPAAEAIQRFLGAP
ncbi:alpha/beta fold hydrolase [Saccharopolyspora phatthalungensis]|uniref:Pimeloyl-ACP methyl ester carboxylesterase n=1 Tax=Saccharopolyspora phatthalungensis TaxID=664693 RepID=A0A840Q0A8_9PSEU|nr:alpha/beta hydrolase [Saccharopolyspora phatthalungensis]MBB5153754.1 pimeloyl-ACP methyl ester carboxylesterase [Saccharopolyspora phatthalungensis]